jgi:hypothetical protein
MKKVFMAIATVAVAFAMGYSAHSTEKVYVQVPTDTIDWYGLPQDSISEYIFMAEDEYCQEIDSLCLANGCEVDADACDIANSQQMEEWAIKHLGSGFFYHWRQTQSKTAREYDVMIARYCY